MGQEPVEQTTLKLTPQQIAAIEKLVETSQEIVGSLHHLLSIFPLSSATITFDDYPMLLAGPISSGTDLTQHNILFSFYFGVTFKNDSGTQLPKPVYAVTDFITGAGNVVSLTNPGPNSGENPWFTDTDGTIIATFNPPVRKVSIEAYPAALTSSAGGRPYIQALDATGAEIPHVRAVDQSSLASSQQFPGVYTAPGELITISRPQADIYGAEISLDANDCEAVFDNLSYER